MFIFIIFAFASVFSYADQQPLSQLYNVTVEEDKVYFHGEEVVNAISRAFLVDFGIVKNLKTADDDALAALATTLAALATTPPLSDELVSTYGQSICPLKSNFAKRLGTCWLLLKKCGREVLLPNGKNFWSLKSTFYSTKSCIDDARLDKDLKLIMFYDTLIIAFWICQPVLFSYMRLENDLEKEVKQYEKYTELFEAVKYVMFDGADCDFNALKDVFFSRSSDVESITTWNNNYEGYLDLLNKQCCNKKGDMFEFILSLNLANGFRFAADRATLHLNKEVNFPLFDKSSNAQLNFDKHSLNCIISSKDVKDAFLALHRNSGHFEMRCLNAKGDILNKLVKILLFLYSPNFHGTSCCVYGRIIDGAIKDSDWTAEKSYIVVSNWAAVENTLWSERKFVLNGAEVENMLWSERKCIAVKCFSYAGTLYISKDVDKNLKACIEA